jgi:hypothetical protein
MRGQIYMLSQKLLDEIVSKQDIYENKTYQINGRFSDEREIFDIQKGFQNFIKETIKNNLGEKSVGFIM